MQILKMTKVLLDRNNNYELRLSKPMDSLSHIGMESVTIYFGDEKNTYSEYRTMTKLLQKEDSLAIEIPKGTTVIRVDLSENPSYYSDVELKDSSGKACSAVYSNGVVVDNLYLFSEPDPQLIYEVEEEGMYQLCYKMISIDNPSAPDYIGKVFAAKMLESQDRLKNLEAELQAIKEVYSTVIHSRRWIIPTKILKFLRIRK